MTSTPPQPRHSSGDQHFIHGDKTASRRRSQSFSSSSHSLSSNSSSFASSLSFHGDHHHTPMCPRSPLQFMGVPFSWEKIPGIPKQLYASNKISDERSLLPLPPPAGKQSFRDEFSPRKSAGAGIGGSFREDPFFAALVECSKEERHKSSSKIVTKSLSDRFGFMGLYAAASCKTTCGVSESIVHLPRSRDYDLLSRRSRR
nr:putative mediator of RNA polymerase II transcription subunit 26 [Ipomoea batatas]